MYFVKSEQVAGQAEKFRAELHFGADGTYVTQFGSSSVLPQTNHWEFSGCGATPATSDVWNPNVVCTTTGEVTVTLQSTYSDGGTTYTANYEFKAYVVGGPITFESNRVGQKRHGSILDPSQEGKLQPWILNWYGFKRGQNPSDIQATTELKVTASTLPQPSGVTESWYIPPGSPIEFTEIDTKSAVVSATGRSLARGDGSIWRKYSMTVDGVNYSFMDCSLTYYSNSDTGDPNANTISCLKPLKVEVVQGGDDAAPVWRVKEVPEDGTVTLPNGQTVPCTTYNIERMYALEVLSQWSDPMDHVFVQEKIETTYDPEALALIAAPPEVSSGWSHIGDADDESDFEGNLKTFTNRSGFTYYARFWDYMGINFKLIPAMFTTGDEMPRLKATSPDRPLQTMVQHFIAGTLNPDSEDAVDAGTHTVKKWLDAVVRTVNN